MKSKRILLTAEEEKSKREKKNKQEKGKNIHRGFNEETMMRAVKLL